MKICWKCTHPRAIQDVDEVVSSSEQIWRNVLSLHHLFTIGPSAVNGCRQNQSQLIKGKKLSVRNKSIIKEF